MKTLDQQRRLWRRATAALAIAAIAALAVPAVSWAGAPGPFTDVPADHDFAPEISEVANAGVAQGFSDGTYRPGTAVSRQAMAAFLSRAGSSIAELNSAGVTITSNSPTTIQANLIDVPGVVGEDTHQFVNVLGQVSFEDAAPLGCSPCTLALRIRDNTDSVNGTERFYTLEANAFADLYDTITINEVFEVGPGVHQMQLTARWAFASGGGTSMDIATVNLTSTVIPFEAFAAL
jgi:hypothetical protein